MGRPCSGRSPCGGRPSGLPAALAELLRDAPPFDRLAVTMTGELCDCYETKRQGVHAILDAVERRPPATPVRVWTTNGRLSIRRRPATEP